MKQSTILLSMLLFSMSSSCAIDPYNEAIQNNNKTEQTEQSHIIKLDDALNSLKMFLSTETKGEALFNKEIENILYLSKHPIQQMTRTSSSVEEDSTCLLYVVNFKDNQGYAMLSADTRLPSEIYAVTEMGNVTESEIYSEDSTSFSPAQMAYRAASGHLVITDTINTDPFIGGDPMEPGRDPMPDHPEGEWIVTRWTNWNDEISVPMMLKTKWGQDNPYNNKIPAPYAGCTTTAVAQVIAYNAYPLEIGGVTIPYNAIRNIKYVFDTIGIC